MAGLAVALRLALTVARSSGEQDLPHAHGQEAEGRGVLGFLCAAVMAAVWVTPVGGGGQIIKDVMMICNKAVISGIITGTNVLSSS